MISVIIPTFNESALLPATLAHIQANNASHEILVVDAESADATAKLAEAAGSRVLLSQKRQRAAQMNLGASCARGEVLLFLHADTLLANVALVAILEALSDSRVVGGAFARRYQPATLFLQCTCLLAEWRSRWLGWNLGDQAMFVRRSVFERLGGFREIGLFEDLDFSRRLLREGRVVTLRPPVVSSARRFARHGAFVTTFRDFWLTVRYLVS